MIKLLALFLICASSVFAYEGERHDLERGRVQRENLQRDNLQRENLQRETLRQETNSTGSEAERTAPVQKPSQSQIQFHIPH